MPYRYGSAGHTRAEQIDAQLDAEGAYILNNHQLVLSCTIHGRDSYANALLEDGCRIGTRTRPVLSK